MRVWTVLAAVWIAGLSSGWIDPAQAQVAITKVPVKVGTQTFDLRKPPRHRPLLSPPEEAVCASDFLSDASVGGQAMQTDSKHGKLTIDQINVTLRLDMAALPSTAGATSGWPIPSLGH